jgi:hypothetical protein
VTATPVLAAAQSARYLNSCASADGAGGVLKSPISGADAPMVLSKTEERLNTVCPYFTMFPLEFPLQFLGDAQPGQWVLDPFCGRGTTLFAARALGLNAVGIDANPVAAAIAAAKVARVNATAVEALAVSLLRSTHEPTGIPTGEFWNWVYHPHTLRDLCSLREQLLDRTDPAAAVLRAIVLGILHGPLRVGDATYLSNQMPRTYATKPDAAVRFWQKRNMQPPYVNVAATVIKRIHYTLVDVPGDWTGDVHCGDSAQVLPRLRRKFDWIVTSPPYYQMRTYVPDQWLRNWFVGGPATVDYTAANQVSHAGVAAFTTDLATIWRRVADRSNRGARMAIRFGGLPSIKGDTPEKILLASLKQAEAGWEVQEVRDAGEPVKAARQAEQMGQPGDYAPEVDCYAILTK